jgi:hypothetical protein
LSRQANAISPLDYLAGKGTAMSLARPLSFVAAAISSAKCGAARAAAIAFDAPMQKAERRGGQSDAADGNAVNHCVGKGSPRRLGDKAIRGAESGLYAVGKRMRGESNRGRGSAVIRLLKFLAWLPKLRSMPACRKNHAGSRLAHP